MRQRHGPRIEPRVARIAEFLRGQHLQHDCLGRNLDRRHDDLVLVAEVARRFHVRIARVQIERIGRHRRDTLDSSLCLVPEGDQRRCADGDELQRAADDAVVHHARARDLDPVDLHLREAFGLRVLLDQLVALHHHQWQEADTVLLRDADFVRFSSDGHGNRHQNHECENLL